MILGPFFLAFSGLAAPQDAPKVERIGPPRRFLAADYKKGVLALFAQDGSIEWRTPVKDIHDAWVLPSRNILYQTGWTRVIEVSPDGREAWSYDAAKANPGRRVEIHSFERLPGGNTLIAESGPARLLEIAPDGSVQKEIPLAVEKPDPHHDTRNVRKLASGHYLVCQEGDGKVKEYDPSGKVVWEHPVKSAVYSALRLKNGNTLISAGNGHRVLEVDPSGAEVWTIERGDLAGIELAWVTQVARLPNGNTVLVNCHGRPGDPQIIEVTPEKKVVWSYRDFETLGGATPVAEVLDDPDHTLR